MWYITMEQFYLWKTHWKTRNLMSLVWSMLRSQRSFFADEVSTELPYFSHWYFERFAKILDAITSNFQETSEFWAVSDGKIISRGTLKNGKCQLKGIGFDGSSATLLSYCKILNQSVCVVAKIS
jgi:hypothetical protein